MNRSSDRQPAALNRALSLFRGLKGRGADGNLDLETATMIPLVAAMLADGNIEEAELLQIHSICASSPILERNSRRENEYLIGHAMQIIEDVGVAEACIRAASALSPALRETAFVHAVRVVFADGYVGQLEREIVDRMIDWFKIVPERAQMMVEVVSIMQHPATA